MNENICSNCGKSSKPERIDGQYIIREIEHVLHFERGILYTIRELMIRPGHNIRHFINENRSRLVKPVLFIIVTSLIYTLINHFFHVEEGYVNLKEGEASSSLISTTVMMNSWIQSHYGYTNIIMGVFASLWVKIFFRKYGYNFFEILILLCFVIGMGMLFFSVFTILEALTGFHLMPVSVVISFAYLSWAIGQFFDGSKPVNYIKALVSYLLGMLTFSISITILIILIDLLMRK